MNAPSPSGVEAIETADFKLPACPRTPFVMPALPRFPIIPKTWSAERRFSVLAKRSLGVEKGLEKVGPIPAKSLPCLFAGAVEMPSKWRKGHNPATDTTPFARGGRIGVVRRARHQFPYLHDSLGIA